MSKIYDALKRAEKERELAREISRRSVPNGAALPGPDDQEDYGRLRASIRFVPAPGRLHTILLTSSNHGEGTTRTAIGLATALAAERDTRVLLIEANLRSPALAGRLALDGCAGLREYLAGETTAEALVVKAGGGSFSVIHAGGTATDVNCDAIGEAVEQLQSQFDFVIVDAPPVNRYADTPALAAKMDAVILVVEADRTPVVDAENAKRSLDRVGARLFGVVLNRQRSYVPAALESLL
ncbi:MAG: hypothetical protein A3J75_05455 [Acidobacteria bacterium RBG_16_68_9]|nr:MAG: hypothetical protein A3J75_05455 [Acidobacteria bacterium RBG_16_68_9]